MSLIPQQETDAPAGRKQRGQRERLTLAGAGPPRDTVETDVLTDGQRKEQATENLERPESRHGLGAV